MCGWREQYVCQECAYMENLYILGCRPVYEEIFRIRVASNWTLQIRPCMIKTVSINLISGNK